MRVRHRHSLSPPIAKHAKASISRHVTYPIRHVLSNGLAVVLCPRDHLSRAYVSVMFGVASRHETPEQNGITHVLEHMLFRGTESYSDSTALNAAAEAFGGYLEGATYRDHLLFATGCHPSAIPDAVSILGELVQSPRYRSMGVERMILREEILEGLDADGRSVDIDNVAHRVIFGNEGLGLPIEGTLSTLESLTKASLEAHRKQYLVGSNAVVSIAGPLKPKVVIAALERAFGSLDVGTPPVVAVPRPPDDEPVLKYVRDASSQVDLRLSFRAPAAFSADYPALAMLGRVLTDGLASRMHAELVDKRGIAYSLSAGITTYSDCALFEFDVAVAKDRAAQAMQALLDFAQKSRRLRLRKDELERCLRRHRYEMEFMGDSPTELTHWHGHATLFGLEEQISTLTERVALVTDEDIRAVAQQVFQRRGMVVTAVGHLARSELSRIQDIVANWNL